ncbi:MAG TPA: STAS domain-containing protein [Solirubrobacteraceae bacterium]|nr:STAS domain-containing protein [Solirubrobacteraceae bacterium]
MSALSIGQSARGLRHTITLDGELDLATALDLYASVAPLVYESEAREIELDLSALHFLDSSGLHLILRLRTLCKEHGCTLLLRSPSKQVRRLLEVTGVAVPTDETD